MMWYLVPHFLRINLLWLIFSSPISLFALRKTTRRGQTACQMMHWPQAAPARGSWMKGGSGRAPRFHRDLHHNLLSRPASSWLRRPALCCQHYKPYLSLQRQWSSLTQWVKKAAEGQMAAQSKSLTRNAGYIKSTVDVLCSAGPRFLGRRGQF